jgi:hypothetical protein
VLGLFELFRVWGNLHLPNLAWSMNSHNKQFKQTLNAQHFWFALSFVLPSNAEGEPVRFGLLNWALA